MLEKIAHLLNRVVRPPSRWLHIVGMAILAVMMVLTFVDVFGRYILNHPLTGTYEITVYMMSILVAFSLAYCAVMKGHVTVDVVVSRFPERAQAIIDSITGLIGLVLFSLITWQCALYVREQFNAGVQSLVLLIPVFPFVGVVALGLAMFTLVLLTRLIEFLSQAVKK